MTFTPSPGCSPSTRQVNSTVSFFLGKIFGIISVFLFLLIFAYHCKFGFQHFLTLRSSFMTYCVHVLLIILYCRRLPTCICIFIQLNFKSFFVNLDSLQPIPWLRISDRDCQGSRLQVQTLYLHIVASASLVYESEHVFAQRSYPRFCCLDRTGI